MIQKCDFFADAFVLFRWKWLGEIKQPDGGFALCKGGEVDVRYSQHALSKIEARLMSNRGAYCAMVMISLLNLPLELPPGSPVRVKGMKSFLDGLPQWLSRCEIVHLLWYLRANQNLQVRHMKVALQALQTQRRMEVMPFVH